MGVYIFKSKHMNAFKIGHYGSDRKVLSNPWSRVSKRGFYSCKCPESIENNVSVHDLDLICWYQNGCVKDELFFHKKFSRERIVGEWFNDNVLESQTRFYIARTMIRDPWIFKENKNNKALIFFNFFNFSSLILYITTLGILAFLKILRSCISSSSLSSSLIPLVSASSLSIFL